VPPTSTATRILLVLITASWHLRKLDPAPRLRIEIGFYIKMPIQ
jgi:hypothetical protein